MPLDGLAVAAGDRSVAKLAAGAPLSVRLDAPVNVTAIGIVRVTGSAGSGRTSIVRKKPLFASAA